MLTRVSQRIAQRQPVRIVTYGDSISEVGRTPGWFGGATSAERNWGSRLNELLSKEYPGVEFTWQAFGIGGQNAFEGLGRIDHLSALQPDLVLIEFGANDCGYHYLPPDATVMALAQMIDSIKAIHAADVVVLSPNGDNPKTPNMRHLHETIAEILALAESKGVPFVNLRYATLKATNQGERWTDYHNGNQDCHPGDNGHALWAGTVMKVLRDNITR